MVSPTNFKAPENSGDPGDVHAAPVVSGETVHLRVPDTEEELNFVRSAYINSLWKNGIQRAERYIDGLQERGFSRHQRDLLRQEMVGAAWLQVRFEDFAEGQKAIRDRLMDRAEIWMAASPVDPWLVLGFVMGERLSTALLVHFVYVKAGFRRLGMGRSLIEAMAGERRRVVATHRTSGWDRLAPRLIQGGFTVEFNPYLAVLPF